MGRPPSDLDDYLDWQERLESFKAGGLSIDEFCLQEGVSRSTYHRWRQRLKEGVPAPMVAERDDQRGTESGQTAFVPITLKASPVEIELPNGAVVRLPLRPSNPFRMSVGRVCRKIDTVEGTFSMAGALAAIRSALRVPHRDCPSG